MWGWLGAGAQRIGDDGVSRVDGEGSGRVM
jgi:hypothetical protein